MGIKFFELHLISAITGVVWPIASAVNERGANIMRLAPERPELGKHINIPNGTPELGSGHPPRQNSLNCATSVRTKIQPRSPAEIIS